MVVMPDGRAGRPIREVLRLGRVGPIGACRDCIGIFIKFVWRL
jgi:hypothetical protein